jgi:phage terminase large subunit-like protein
MSSEADMRAKIDWYAGVIADAAAMSPAHEREARRHLCRTDLFFLMVAYLGRRDMVHPWVFDRCNEVQASPNGHLDLWAREHFKSSIITCGKSIQDILINPEVTIGIFSHTRPIAKGFLRQIKGEFERNEPLKRLFNDILWANPKVEAPKWNEDDGIIVKRDGNPKESTVEAWGLVDGQPTSKHFRLRDYDDVVVPASVTTPEMIAKTIAAWELSLSLGTDGGAARYIGTRYHANDPYREIMARGAAKPRIYTATDDGTPDGNPVLLSAEELRTRRRDSGPYTFACQYLQSPTADSKQGFNVTWLRYHQSNNDGRGLNRYIIVDPASAKKKTSDYTTMWVIGLGADENYYALDMIRDRLNLMERGDALFALHRRWKPLGVGYEQYGMQCDIEYLQDRMGRENYRFEITPLGGQMAKPDRIKRLMPTFEQGRILLPDSLYKTDYQGKAIDLVQSFIEEEYKPFPVPVHDDMLDSLARIEDPDFSLIWPKERQPEDRYAAKRRARGRQFSSWAA